MLRPLLTQGSTAIPMVWVAQLLACLVHKTIAIKVSISKPYPAFFSRILGWSSITVGARGTAEYTSYATAYFQNDGSISSLQAAFVNNGPYALGPLPGSAQNGVNSYGDYYSALYCNDGITPNPLYSPAGYNFGVNIPSNYTQAQLAVEIFDPDSANGSGSTEIDEVHGPAAPLSQFVTDNRNKTKYSIIYTDPATRAETEITSVTYDPANANYMSNNMKWAQDLLINAQDARWKGVPGTLRLQVQALNGASENGFYVRTGPPHDPAMTDAQWKTAYGPSSGNNPSSWTALGRMSFNFFQSGTARIDLGVIGPSAAGSPLQITSYDLEGGQNIRYTCDTPYSGYPSGGITGNNVRQNGIAFTDTINLPTGYAGGHWYVDYTASRHDSSSWQINYPSNTQGRVRLVE